MSITVWGILLGALLLAIPVYVIYRFKLKIINRVLAAVCRMVLVVFATALLAYTAIKLNSVGFSIVAFLLLVSVSSILVVRKSGLKPTKLLIPVMGGMLLSTTVIGFYVLFFVLGLKNPFVPQYFLPVMGLIAFGMISVNARALQIYYMGLKNHSQLYYYLLGNGSNHHEAVSYLLRRCLQASIVSSTRQLSRIVMVSAPVLMFGMMLGGAGVLEAAVCQVIFMIVLMATSIGSVLLTLFLARRGSFDEYERLKPVFKNRPEPTSNSSASPSISQHTDPENQLQEE